MDEETEAKYKKLCRDYERIGVICLTELMSVMFHFNYRKEIANIIAKKLKSRDDEVFLLKSYHLIKKIHKIAAKCISNFFADSNPGTCKYSRSISNHVSRN